MKRLILLLYSLNVLWPAYAAAETYSTQDFKAVYNSVIELQKKYPPDKILVVFSAHHVLLNPVTPMLRLSQDYIPIVKKILKNTSRKNSKYLDDILVTNYEYALSDKNAPKIIEDIISSGSYVMLLSGSITGKLNQIPRFEVWFLEYLQKLGIKTSTSFAAERDFSMPSTGKGEAAPAAVFYHGLLSTGSGRGTASSTLVNFLYKSAFMPDAVIYVGSAEDPFDLMETQLQILSDSNTVFIGYKYETDIQIIEDADKQSLIKFWTGVANLINDLNPLKAERKVKSSR